jgi:hypothetical protein
MTARQLSDGNPDGQVLGQSITDKIAFFNSTPIVQRSGAALAAITDSTGGTGAATFAAITAGGAYAQADIVAIKNALAFIAAELNEIRSTLVAYGLHKGAA